MKLHLLLIAFAMGFGAAYLGGTILPQQEPTQDEIDDDDDVDEAEQEELDPLMAALQPGPQHELLNQFVGTWNTTTRMWIAGPEQNPISTNGVMTYTWVLDNRFLLQEMEGKFPLNALTEGQQDDVPWKGMGLFGYDGLRNMYVGCWAESMGTQMLTMRGSVSPDGKTFTYYGEMDEPTIGVVGRTVKYQTRVVDENTHVFTVYDLYGGDDTRIVEITMTRKKDQAP